MTAETYFWTMAVLAIPLGALHLRDREYTAAMSCAAMLWFMWLILPIMEAMCATNPTGAAVAHIPWIIATGAVLLAKMRSALQRYQTKQRALPKASPQQHAGSLC